MTTTTVRRRQPIKPTRRILVAAAIAILITASLTIFLISVNRAESESLAGSVLLWHALSENETMAMDEVLAEFEKLNPQTTVHQQAFTSREELLEQYRESVHSGLGPDLLLGDAAWVNALAGDNAIRPISGEIDGEMTEFFLPAAIDSLTYHDELYGLPLWLHVPALYYNTKLVETPAESLDALLTQAAQGDTVLIGTSFRDSFWGVQAFGGRFLDEQGRSILDQGGYANWLDWLMTARSAPGMILDSNRESLRERFLEGDASYYVGYPDEMQILTEGLGADNLGVAPLPSGPVGSAGPFLDVDALLFSPVSSENQVEIATDLAGFLTNAEQGAKFMRESGAIPANTQVRINPRLHPLMAGFLAQARSAVALPNLDTKDSMWSIAASAYDRVMSGLITPLEAAVETTAAINELNGFATDAQAASVCTDIATIRLVHDWTDDEAGVLDNAVEAFKRVCPLVIVNTEYVEDLDSVRARWKSNPYAATNPDVILASQEWLTAALAEEIAFHDIGMHVPGETLQRYVPAAVAGMREGQRLLGLPVSFDVHALYYNKALVDDPASVLERLRLQADDGLPIVLDARFVPSYWGVGAFGGRLMNAENQPALGEGGFVEWLNWLRASRDSHGIRLVFTQEEARTAFLDGASAYYVGRPNERSELLERLGPDNLAVTLLPSGPEGAATPLFLASGFLFSGNMTERELSAALGFALYATDAERQQDLVERTSRAPANGTIDLTDYPHIAPFVEQARTAYPLPNCAQIETVLELGDQVYADVLINGTDPEEAIQRVVAAINEACGLEASPLAAPATEQDSPELDDEVEPEPENVPTQPGTDESTAEEDAAEDTPDDVVPTPQAMEQNGNSEGQSEGPSTQP